MTYQYDHPRPAVSVDTVVLRKTGENTELLLIRRGREPFADRWALPGGFMEMDETLEQAAARELREETGLVADSIRQVGVFSTVDRDPRGRVITVAFLVTVADDRVAVAGDDARQLTWFPVRELPPLAFDHAEIIATALQTPQPD